MSNYPDNDKCLPRLALYAADCATWSRADHRTPRWHYRVDALPGAFSLAQLQARERERGFQVTEPSDAGGQVADAETESVPVAASEAPAPAPIADPIATPEGLTAAQVSIFEAAANTIYRWRTVRSVARQVRLAQGAVQGDLEKLVELGHIQKRSPKTDGVIVYGAVARVA